MRYTIHVLHGDTENKSSFRLRDGDTYAYTYHIHDNEVTGGTATFYIYREGETSPFEQVTYILK